MGSCRTVLAVPPRRPQGGRPRAFRIGRIPPTGSSAGASAGATPSDVRRAGRAARGSSGRREPERLARSPGVGGCDSPAARRTRATAAAAGLCARGSRLRRGGDSTWAAGAAYRAVTGHTAAPSMGVAWAGGGGSWSARLPGSVSFAACACGMTSAPTSMRRSSRSGAR